MADAALENKMTQPVSGQGQRPTSNVCSAQNIMQKKRLQFPTTDSSKPVQSHRMHYSIHKGLQ